MRLRLWYALSISEHLVLTEIFRTKPGILCDPCQRRRPDFLTVVKAEREVSPPGFCNFL
jgi:hypothetical protein